MIYNIVGVQPLSVNTMYRTFRGRVIMSKRGREVKKEITKQLKEQNVQKICGQVKVSVEFYFKTRHKRDIDNYFKGLLDCCKDVIFEDDDMIYEISARKYIGAEDNQIIIEVEECKDIQD